MKQSDYELETDNIIKDLVRVFTEGRNYENKNPYLRLEVRQALRYLADKQGIESYLDVSLK